MGDSEEEVVQEPEPAATPPSEEPVTEEKTEEAA